MPIELFNQPLTRALILVGPEPNKQVASSKDLRPKVSLCCPQGAWEEEEGVWPAALGQVLDGLTLDLYLTRGHIGAQQSETVVKRLGEQWIRQTVIGTFWPTFLHV